MRDYRATPPSAALAIALAVVFNETMPVTLVLVRDLMFSSKISATAKATGVAVDMVREPLTLGNRQGDRLIVDLNQPGALDAATAWRAAAVGRHVIGFVSHVDTETIASARSAGIDRVMPRSQFVATLEALLSE
jgi:hypothetical protein